METQVNSLIINGRRWFQRSYGSTYCTADIYVNGEHVHTTPIEYGYGDYYLQAAGEWLAANGYVPHEHRHYLPHYCDEAGIDLVNSVSDVSRERDL